MHTTPRRVEHSWFCKTQRQQRAQQKLPRHVQRGSARVVSMLSSVLLIVMLYLVCCTGASASTAAATAAVTGMHMTFEESADSRTTRYSQAPTRLHPTPVRVDRAQVRSKEGPSKGSPAIPRSP